MTAKENTSDAQSDAKKTRHEERMKQRKEIVDGMVAKATIERGILIVLTGDGKGKSSSAFGTAVRCLGHGFKVGIVQFIKGSWDCGERTILENLPGCEFHVMGTGFTWDTQDSDKDREAAEKVWSQCEHLFKDPDIKLIVLDELTYMLNYKYLDKQKVIEAIQNRPKDQNVIITGRGAKKYLTDIADTVSEVKAVKHAFNNGIKAQKGIEW
tara:strand:- start:1534 stop:2166 length:633 start_codon:yes stop_codon:yes gene_type:complete